MANIMVPPCSLEIQGASAQRGTLGEVSVLVGGRGKFWYARRYARFQLRDSPIYVTVKMMIFQQYNQWNV